MQRRDLAVLRIGMLGLVSLLGACDKGEAKPKEEARAATDTKDTATKVADAKVPDAKVPDAKVPAAKAVDAKPVDTKTTVIDPIDDEDKTTAEPETDPTVPAVSPEPPPAAGGVPTGPVLRPVDTGLPPDEIPVDQEPELELELTYETIGGVHVDMPAAEVLAKLGKPQRQSKESTEAATGNYVQTWHYEGLEVGMKAETRKGAQTVAFLAAKAACKLPASWGLAIGSTRAEVEKVYAKGIVPDLSGPEQLLAGSPYAGVTFDFVDDKVTGIFMGGGE